MSVTMDRQSVIWPVSRFGFTAIATRQRSEMAMEDLEAHFGRENENKIWKMRGRRQSRPCPKSAICLIERNFSGLSPGGAALPRKQPLGTGG